MPLKSARSEPYGAAGAGAANVSPVPEFVGRQVPDVMTAEAGRDAEAVSSKVRLTLTVSKLLPTSDMRMIFCPPGPTSRMSTSPGKVWLKPKSWTITRLTVPVTPETLMADGYGEEIPDVPVGAVAGILMVVLLAKGPAEPAASVPSRSG